MVSAVVSGSVCGVKIVQCRPWSPERLTSNLAPGVEPPRKALIAITIPSMLWALEGHQEQSYNISRYPVNTMGWRRHLRF